MEEDLMEEVLMEAMEDTVEWEVIMEIKEEGSNDF